MVTRGTKGAKKGRKSIRSKLYSNMGVTTSIIVRNENVKMWRTWKGKRKERGEIGGFAADLLAVLFSKEVMGKKKVS